MALKDYLDKAGNVITGGMETLNAPFEVVGESIRGAGESEPLKMATAADPSGFRYPSIVQRLAPSTRTPNPPADPFTKAYQGLEGITALPWGHKAASDVVTGQPDLAAVVGGMGLGLGVMPPVAKKISTAEMPKALLNERGNVALGAGSELSKPPAAASPWFSRIENALQEKLPANPDVGQVKNILSTLPKEEAQWRGLDEFLSKRFGQVPKTDIMEHLKQNPVKVGERVFGDKEPTNAFNAYRQELKNKYDTGMLEGKLTPEETDKWNSLSDAVREAENKWAPKFEQHSTPGGSNYREVVLTLPDKHEEFRAAQNADYMALKDQVQKRIGEPIRNLYDVYDKGNLTYEETQQLLSLDNRRNPFPDAFQSSHFPEAPNPIAHIRFKDFDDPISGKKTLLVDEIQSDWHQKGRAKGYQGDMERITTPEEKELQALNHKTWVGTGNLTPAESLRQKELQTKVGVSLQEKANRSRGGVQDAPFKKNWQELAFKRALKEAVDGGYDEMAWTTGKQQADRYDLSKQIDNLKVLEGNYSEVDGVKGYEVTAFNKGKNIISKRVPESDLPDLIGKDMAKKAIAQIEENKKLPVPKYAADFSGLDLKVGGEGMEGFYDDILPTYANKYLKKYGVKVADGPISAEGRQRSTAAAGGRMKPGSWVVLDAEGNFKAGMPSEKEALKWGYENKIHDFTVMPNDVNENLIVHKIPITPEMKADILSKGQPMWKMPAMIGAGAAGAGAAANAEANQQKFAGGGIVQEYPNMKQEDDNEDWKNEMAGYMDQHYGEPQGQKQYMADGGFAGGYEDDLLQQSVPFQTPPTSTPAAGPVFNPKAGLPPEPAPAMPAAAPAGPPAPDPLQNYLSQQKEMLNRYGPEQQLELERQIQKQRSGVVPVLANAATGFADAIMQGVARAGPSNFQANLQNRLDKSQEGQRDALKNAQTGHLAKMKQEMELANMDPSSPISRLAQRSAMPLLTELGLSDEEIQNIPASLIGEAQTKQLTLEEIRTKAEETRALRDQTAAYQNAVLGAGVRKEKAEATEKAGERQYQAAKDIESRDKAPKFEIFGSKVPYGFSPVSREQRRAAGNVIRGRMSGAPTVTTTSPIPQAAEAEAWALANPNDPKSAEILRRLGK